MTWPDFEGEYIDQEVFFMDKRSFQPPRPPQPPDPENDGEAVVAGHDCVLVRDRENKITGLVTGTDISEQFHLLAEPFLLLEEIEKRIRALILRRFSLEDLQAAKNAADADRKISDVSDLSFGEYVRLLENENRWHKLQLKVDRVKFIEQLSRIRDIRNDVMHFDPDGVTDDALDDLRRFSRFLDRIQMLIH